MITVDEYLAQHGAGYEAELDDDLRANAQITVDRANAVLEAFGESRGLRSGWRPRSVNDATPNAAHNSRHITCEAIDIEDDDKRLQEWCSEHDGERLIPFDCYMENPIATPSWVHLQIVPPGSGLRVYFPNATWARRAHEEGLA